MKLCWGTYKTFSGQIAPHHDVSAIWHMTLKQYEAGTGRLMRRIFCAHPVRAKSGGAEYDTYAYVDRSFDFRLGLA
jgi:hypothetical protein